MQRFRGPGQHRDADPRDRIHTGRAGVGADRAVEQIKGSTKAERCRKGTNRAHMCTVEPLGKLTAFHWLFLLT